ncbi:dual specificity protein phosphatase 12 [Paramormyrops kingsleyae]|uniref:Dual specificity protein phosphatase 12 n=1 Tax=Paramormyrops kingsleyae TaxID=1676925 RepID=A0A3B3T771_9TELE|nr:dual specificity protein phosphatase 12 [Paramormyrops kingsleyae]XP_023662268.1 dual specificity protein phosphatase 12 [Paramormyrops kingsleyae]XP_023662269.1 dual specificity protein phosphatase 12 [Paramormyrops kingsleyae]XP_023662270.1 dual specificity protein phosphatase 12 [Paramormyrops kingsleyae]XP_023662271.1 dual specificity protein phosphatase 12 [Paramormyrops kingsleyae]
MIVVEPGLYIGSTSDLKDCQELINAGITHILTVDSEKPNLPEVFKTKFVRALDEATTDLLSCLDDCLRFIHEGIDGASGAVLVHCHAGQSRSAAVVTAFLMKSKQLNAMDAYAKLQQIKSNVKMNEEFLRQLELFESMNCEVDVTSPVYKQYRLQKITEKYPELQAVPREIFAADPVTDTSSSDVIHRCRKCRRTVFRRSSVLSHTPGAGPTAFGHKKVTGAATQAPGCAQTQCTSYFIEPVQWMEEALLGVMDGQLLCPKCNSKLGSFNWYGEQCSCGRWVTPAFQIHKNRVDEIKHISVSALK